MKNDTITQFISFETTVETKEFRSQWDEYNNLVTGEQEVTLQQEIDGKNIFRYLSQHRFHNNEVQFVFKKGRRSAHSSEVEMRIRAAGGYSTLQSECTHDTDKSGCKVFVFLNNTPDLNIYKKLLSYQYLNIYQAYFESCAFTYILEFYVDNIHVSQLIEQLKIHNRISEIGVYKECIEPKKGKASKTNIVKKILI